MVGDDQFEAKLPGGLGFSNAAIPQSTETTSEVPRPGQLAQSLVVQAVAFVHAIGHIVARRWLARA